MHEEMTTIGHTALEGDTDLRTSTAIAKTACICLKFTRINYQKIISKIKYKEKKDICSFLSKTDLFQKFNSDLIEKLVNRLTILDFKKGDVIYRQDDLGNTLYVV
mmetsp:Transcript_23928/g.53140  ORF Transcript_23928/g.53140 Transcript_23928/m.53140 type:complete len:105 (+) Transcript_23928:455-769(+)